MVMTPTKRKMAAASVPRTRISELRHELDYGDSKLPRCSAFNDDVRAFRKKFLTSSGLRGLELHDWKSSAHQAGLSEMTTAYLDHGGNGSLFWPDDVSSPRYNTLQYSKHRPR
jgi:hypothetical protein